MECLKKCGMTMLEWLVRLLNLSFDMGAVPMNWRGGCIVPLYKGKGEKCECISLLSVIWKRHMIQLNSNSVIVPIK